MPEGECVDIILSPRSCSALHWEKTVEVEESKVLKSTLIPHCGFRIWDCAPHHTVSDEEGITKGDASCLSPNTH